MLKVTDTLEFTHPVKVQVPVDGGHITQEFEARFRAVDDDDLAGLSPKEQLRRVWIGWGKVVDDAKEPVPFSEEMREQLIGRTFIRFAVLRAYAEAVTGGKRGN